MQNKHITVSIPLSDSMPLTLIQCPSGSFQMGGGSLEKVPAEIPQHEVWIERDFWMGQTLITRSQFSSLMGGADRVRVNENSPNCPAAQHTWLDAVEFCEKLYAQLHGRWSEFGLNSDLDYRISLPTEQQWEYACRAGTTTKWFFGDDQSELENYAWYGRNVNDFSPIPEVMQKLPNPWGLYDLYGLVYEWCMNDIYNYRDTIKPPISYPSMTDYSSHVFKALRGGAVDSHFWQCRSASRSTLSHWNTESDFTGFRVVLIPE